MKKLILCSALLLSSSIAFAQSEPVSEGQNYKAHSEMSKHKTRFETELNLSDEQKVKVQEIRSKYKSSQQESREAEMAEINSVLTPEQQAKAKTLHKERFEKIEKHKQKRDLKDNKKAE